MVHVDDFTLVYLERIDIVPPNWESLFKYHDKFSDGALAGTPLIATLEN